MRTIWKFPLAGNDANNVVMPAGAKVLTVQMQDRDVTLWAEVDDKAKTNEARVFLIFGTGHPMPREMGYRDVYIGTVQDRSFVWHVYEQTGV
jgi:hypothetical protein